MIPDYPRPAVVLHSAPEHERTVLHSSRNPLAAFDALVGARDPLTGCLDRSNLERLGARLASDGEAPVGADLVVDHQGIAARRLDATPGTAYLLRPDQHVCARWRAFDAGKVRAALARATCNV